ncbi:MAG TPA: folate-binding protein, partial [Burkholderiales bacterium]|nr:folate-binding protein [Burkholderiales bacterium]
QGARYENGVLRDFGNPEAERLAARDSNILVALPALALLRVTGADAKNFLNGQFTNDLNLVDASHSQLDAWCTAQGRMLVLMRILERDGAYLLQLPRELRDEFVKRLRMYVLRAKVTVEDADAELVCFGLIGSHAAQLLAEATSDAPTQDDQTITRDGVTLLRVAGVRPRFQVIAPPSAATALWNKLRARAMPAGFDTWAWHDILAGIPTILPATREAFVPQMANLELVGGVNFKKGCYPGQEIVARMQYLGRLKQRMYRAHAAGETPAAGTAVFAPGSEQSVGTVVDARPSPDGGSDMSAVIQIAAVEAGELHLGNAQGAKLSITVPPYSFDAPQTKAS